MKLSNDVLNLLSQYKTITYNTGDIIFSSFEKCESIGIILSGLVKITTITYMEKEETISLLEKHDVFGNVLIFSEDPYYLGDIIAEKKTTVVLITKKELINLLQTNQMFLEAYLEELSNTSLFIKQQNKLLIHKNIKDRILYYFSSMAKKQHSKTIKIPSVTKLAMILSLPRPSVSRELTNLENENIIIKKKNTITLLI